MGFNLDDRETSKTFAAYLQNLEARLSALEGSNPLTNASIESGSLDIYDDDGTLRASLGMQGDGTVALVPVNSEPPPTPTAPTVEPTLAGLVVTWDGTWADSDITPADYATIQIHVSGAGADYEPDLSTLASTISAPLGGSATVAVDGYAPVWVRLVATNTAALTGPPSEATESAARQAVPPDLIDGIVTEVKLAQDAVTAAKIALGAVTEPKILAGAITTDKLVALAVTAEKIAALAITTDKLAALSVTADQLAANAVTATKIAAGAIEATHIKAGAITAEKIDADALNGKTITGAIVRTAALGDRVELTNSGTTGLLRFFNSANRLSAAISSSVDDEGMQAFSVLGPDPAGTNWGGRPRMLLSADGAKSTAQLNADKVVIGSGSPLWNAAGTVQVVGYLNANNIATGRVRITPTPNVPTSMTVTGLGLPRNASSIYAVATPYTTVPGISVTGVGITDPTPMTLTVWLTRSNNSLTSVDYIAIATG
ncbi:hypothetical protein ABZ804_22245 [Streptomyces sp. NPDC047726]|uniref:hypothetical protein n=1 Tax=unclassified Streptomyces TaxID=2593676 RepID=UPI0033F7D645